MDDILAYLEELTHPETQPPEYFVLLNKTEPYIKAIQEQFSLSFLDALTDAQNEAFIWLENQAFSRGFRMGVQLTLAGLQSFSS